MALHGRAVSLAISRPLESIHYFDERCRVVIALDDLDAKIASYRFSFDDLD